MQKNRRDALVATGWYCALVVWIRAYVLSASFTCSMMVFDVFLDSFRVLTSSSF